MIGTLYRYPHPHDSTKFIYVGQGPNRDADHRAERSSFGARFRRKFPEDRLPLPIREQIEISSQLELNEEETIWMFRYHTWWGYPDGMNLQMPGLSDYKNIGRLGNNEGKRRGGIASGKIAVEKGQIQELGRKAAESGIWHVFGRKRVESGFFSPEHQSKAGKIGGKISGKKAFESGQLASITTFESCHKGGKIGGKVSTCLRWRIRRGKSCICGKHNL